MKKHTKVQTVAGSLTTTVPAFVRDMLDLKKTMVNVITKSGSTAETMSQFMIIKDRLYNLLGDDYRKNIVATTDKQVGILRQLANEEGYKTFVVPDDVNKGVVSIELILVLQDP